MMMRVESWLEPFSQSPGGTAKPGQPRGAVSLVAGERSAPYPHAENVVLFGRFAA